MINGGFIPIDRIHSFSSVKSRIDEPPGPFICPLFKFTYLVLPSEAKHPAMVTLLPACPPQSSCNVPSLDWEDGAMVVNKAKSFAKVSGE